MRKGHTTPRMAGNAETNKQKMNGIIQIAKSLKQKLKVYTPNAQSEKKKKKTKRLL